MKNCDARIAPLPDKSVIVDCEGDHEPGTGRHEGVLRDYAHPGSKTSIGWHESDRRNFRGEYFECPTRGCILPADHPRRCHVE